LIRHDNNSYTNQQELGGALFFKVIFFIYFIPTVIALVRLPILKWKFLTVFFINLFFGWTVYGWWISFGKALSSGNKKIILQVPGENSNSFASENKYDQLGKLQDLKNSGAITEEEYEKEKKKILKK